MQTMRSCSLKMTDWASMLRAFDAAASSVGLRVQKVAFGPSPDSCVTSEHIVVVVNHFTYLGSDVDSSIYCTPGIIKRISLKVW